MKKIKAIIQAADASMYKYPYQNLSPVDMAGEIWKPMPEFEEYYMVSNKGRIKSLAREVAHYIGKHFITHTTEEVIMKQSIFKSFAKYRQEYSSYGLTFRCTVGKITEVRRVSRAVYEAFVEPVPNKMVVLHKNDDPFDNSVENLYPATQKELARKVYEKNREAINRKQGLTAEVIVSQYDLEGNYLNTYRNLLQAAEAVEINASSISSVINGKRRLTAGGYYWRRGDSKDKIDTSFKEERMKQIKQINSEMQSRRIVQFDLTGKFIAVHNSIKEAVEKTGLSRDAIGDVLRGKRYLSREYIWKYADSFDEIPDQIKVEEYRLPEPAVVPKSRKELNLPEYEYPYQDLHLSDMENEIWKPVPGLEEYCMVSNKGRVKARTRFVDNTNHGRQVLKERIIRQGLRKLKTNPHTGITAQCLYFAIQFDNNLHQMAVARAVYSAFIKPLRDFGEEQIFILHRDLDALNNRVENLYAATRKETAERNITEGWMVPYDIAKFSKSKKLHG